MSDYNDASIVMFPSGRKASKLYSQKPLDGTADFAVTRASVANEINSDGLVSEVAANVPRFEYGVGVTCQSLLLEPEGINNAVYSEDFTNANWGKTNITVTSNSAVAPDGNSTADTITADADGGQFQFAYTGSSGSAYVNSFYIKRKTGTGDIKIRGVDNISTTITITDEWTRVYVTNTSSASTIRIGLKLSNAGDEVYLWGAQSELGSLPSSYIRNLTTGSTTRPKDELNKTGLSSYINSEEGVFFVEMAALSDDQTDRRLQLKNAAGSNQVRIDFKSGGSNIISAVLFNGADQAVLTNNTHTITDYNKIAFVYKLNDFALWINGVKVDTDSSGTTVSAGVLDRIELSQNTVEVYAKIKQLQVYKTALTDTELIALTT